MFLTKLIKRLLAVPLAKFESQFMQTPSHLAISLFIWRKMPDWRCTLAVAFGAALPDLAMFLFYGYQKWIGSSEKDIWGILYFQEQWQFFFDWFNSIPIFLALAIAFHWCKFRIGFLIAASALVHVLCDLPLHNDDAHRHFLPFSHWKFVSPVSYWDPEHFGIYAMLAELAIGVGASAYLVFGKFSRSVRIAGGITLSFYIVGLILAAVIWSQYQPA